MPLEGQNGPPVALFTANSLNAFQRSSPPYASSTLLKRSFIGCSSANAMEDGVARAAPARACAAMGMLRDRFASPRRCEGRSGANALIGVTRSENQEADRAE